MHKKAYVTDIITDIVYVTVTAGQPLPTSAPDTTIVVSHTVYAHHKPKTTTKPKSTTPPPPPPPAPTPTPAPAPVVEAPKPVSVAPPPPPPPPPAPVETPAPKVVETPAPVVAQEASAPTDYASTCVYHHNAHRANHTAPNLSWDAGLAKSAKAVADSCVFAHDMTQGGGGYGQNLAAYGTTADMSSINLGSVAADAITNQWYYGEAANMPYGQNSPAISNVPEYLHFSQVLWKSTNKVGCATVSCGAGTIFKYHSLYTGKHLQLSS
ncbi:hypothetical protein VTL71DRAFT_6497 [Oculimacula yallundae]|uniref:SCP domain-containing protein n=1 Tax=Oculimacula yallundae TaxID=86028 RepID=A0ABR4BX62_9HELO